MIINKSENIAISSLGWCDKSSFCVIDIPSHERRLINLENARYVSIKKLIEDYFLCIHHFDGEKIILSIQSFTKPDSVISKIVIQNHNAVFMGDLDLWKSTQRYFVGYLKDNSNSEYKLVEIDPKSQGVTFHCLDWFDSSYDRTSQGIIDVIAIPDSPYLLFSIQRDSTPVLYNMINKKIEKKIKLVGRGGNPVFSFRNKNEELWCVDYDTLVKLRVSDWSIVNFKRLQTTILPGSREFIGDFSFTSDEKYCAVARPASNDIVLLDCLSFRKITGIKVKDKPIAVAVMSDWNCVYRDWKTGEVGFAKFSK